MIVVGISTRITSLLLCFLTWDLEIDWSLLALLLNPDEIF